jgi:hypothetical protein
MANDMPLTNNNRICDAETLGTTLSYLNKTEITGELLALAFQSMSSQCTESGGWINPPQCSSRS